MWFVRQENSQNLQPVIINMQGSILTHPISYKTQTSIQQKTGEKKEDKGKVPLKF